MESFLPFQFFQLRLSCVSLLPRELTELRRQGHNFIYFPQQGPQMFANPWEGEETKKMPWQKFWLLSKDNCNISHPTCSQQCDFATPSSRSGIYLISLNLRGPMAAWTSRIWWKWSEVGSALSWPGGFCFLPLETLTLEMPPLRTQPPCCETPKPPAETRRRHSSWQPALPANMRESHLGYPAHSSFQMPAASAAIWAWVAPSKNHPAEPIQPEETWKMINGCFKPLDFGEVCYVAIDNQIPPSSN